MINHSMQLRCLIERDHGLYVGYCLDLGLGVQGDSAAEVREALHAAIDAYPRAFFRETIEVTTMQIAIEVPEDFVNFQGERVVQQDVRMSYGLWLFQSGRVTLAKAAQVAGLDIYDFLSACKERQIPVLAMTEDELLAEVAG